MINRYRRPALKLGGGGINRFNEGGVVHVAGWGRFNSLEFDGVNCGKFAAMRSKGCQLHGSGARQMMVAGAFMGWK